MGAFPGARAARFSGGAMLVMACCPLVWQWMPLGWAAGPQLGPTRPVTLGWPEHEHAAPKGEQSRPSGALPVPPVRALMVTGVGAVALCLSAKVSKKRASQRLGATRRTQQVATKADDLGDKQLEEFSMKLFTLGDQDENNLINYREFEFCVDVLAKCNIKLAQKEVDAFFYRHSSSSFASWERTSVEWMNEVVEGEVLEHWQQNRYTIDTDFTYQQFSDIVKKLDEKHFLAITEADIQAGWQDLHANYFNKRTVPEFAHAVKTACGERFLAICNKGRQTTQDGRQRESVDGKSVRLVKQQMEKEHNFKISQEDTLLFFRTHGLISRGAWFQGMSKLLAKDKANNPKQNLSSEILDQDPEMFRATLDNGIPRQMVYDFDQWQRAQSSERYWKSIRVLMTQQSSLRRIWWPLFFCIVMALVTCIVGRAWKSLLTSPLFMIPVEFFSLSSAPLGLLLVFRTNMSYARFDEARKLWGDSLNRCRDLMRQAAWMPNQRDKEAMLNLVPVFAITLKCLLRKPSRHDLAFEVGPHLTQRDIRQMMTTDLPPPIWALRKMASLADSLHDVSPMQHQLMSKQISELIANVGKCERIFSTPMPATYTSLATRFLLVWLALLPFMLYPKIGDGVVLSQTVMAFFLLGIEDLGCQIEEPFSVLPLTRITDKIKNEAGSYKKEYAGA